MWSGASTAIPTGWLLCNGSNNTPDLRNRFIVGAGNSYSVGATGGEATHTLTVAEMPSHNHSINHADDNGNTYGQIGYEWNGRTTSTRASTNYTGGGQAHNNLPPYYALCFIMKQ